MNNDGLENGTLSSGNMLSINGVNLDDVTVQATVTHLAFNSSNAGTANTGLVMKTTGTSGMLCMNQTECGTDPFGFLTGNDDFRGVVLSTMFNANAGAPEAFATYAGSFNGTTRPLRAHGAPDGLTIRHQTMWRGWQRLRELAEGWALARSDQ